MTKSQKSKQFNRSSIPEPSYFYLQSDSKVQPFGDYSHDELKMNKQNSAKVSSYAMNLKPKLMTHKTGILVQNGTPVKEYK